MAETGIEPAQEMNEAIEICDSLSTPERLKRGIENVAGFMTETFKLVLQVQQLSHESGVQLAAFRP